MPVVALITRYLFTYPSPSLNCQLLEGRGMSWSSLYPQNLMQCQKIRRCSINTCYLNKVNDLWGRKSLHLDYCGKSKLMSPPPQGKWPQAKRHQSQRAIAKEFFSTGSPEEITALSHSITNLVLERRKNARAGSSNQQMNSHPLLNVLLPWSSSSASPSLRPLFRVWPFGVSLWGHLEGGWVPTLLEVFSYERLWTDRLSGNLLSGRVCGRHFHIEHRIYSLQIHCKDKNITFRLIKVKIKVQEIK